MASVLEVLGGAGSLAGVVGVAYQIYSARRERAERRQVIRQAEPPVAPQAHRQAPTVVPSPLPAPARTVHTKAAEPETWFDLLAPWLMGAYLWVMALGGYSFIDDISLAGATPEAINTQLRYTVVLLAVNTFWAAALVLRHKDARPLLARVWVYGFAGLASIGSGVGLVVKYGSMIF